MKPKLHQFNQEKLNPGRDHQRFHWIPCLWNSLDRSRILSWKFCCTSERDSLRAVPWQRPCSWPGSSSGPPHLPCIPHRKGAAGDAHPCLCHEDIGSVTWQCFGTRLLVQCSSLVAVLLSSTLSLVQASSGPPVVRS